MKNPSPRLQGKVAIVTGAAQGIGRTYALALAEAGARVCVSDVSDPAETVRMVEAAGGTAIGCRADVSDADAVDAMIDEVRTAFGRLDIVVNNAALFATLNMKSYTEIEPAEWDRVMLVNVRGSWQVTKSATPLLKASGGGSVINVSSGTVFKGSPYLLHYVASKGAVVAMTRSLAREASAYGIRVNALAPGLVLSAGVQDHPGWHEASAAIVSSRAIRRDSTPEDLVGPLLFLASDDSAFMTGQTVVVDGGSVMH